MGVFEKPPFDKGTRALAELVAGSKAVTVVGGGESVQAAPGGGRRRQVHARVDGRRRVAGVSGGREAAGVEALDDEHRGRRATGRPPRRQLENAQDRAPRRRRSRRSSPDSSATAWPGASSWSPDASPLSTRRATRAGAGPSPARTSPRSPRARSRERSPRVRWPTPGCRYAIVGHSERRRLFGEDGPMLAKKLARCREAGLTPIYASARRPRSATRASPPRRSCGRSRRWSSDPADLPLGRGLRAGLGDRHGPGGDPRRRRSGPRAPGVPSVRAALRAHPLRGVRDARERRQPRLRDAGWMAF